MKKKIMLTICSQILIPIWSFGQFHVTFEPIPPLATSSIDMFDVHEFFAVNNNIVYGGNLTSQPNSVFVFNTNSTLNTNNLVNVNWINRYQATTLSSIKLHGLVSNNTQTVFVLIDDVNTMNYAYIVAVNNSNGSILWQRKIFERNKIRNITIKEDMQGNYIVAWSRQVIQNPTFQLENSGLGIAKISNTGTVLWHEIITSTVIGFTPTVSNDFRIIGIDENTISGTISIFGMVNNNFNMDMFVIELNGFNGNFTTTFGTDFWAIDFAGSLDGNVNLISVNNEFFVTYHNAAAGFGVRKFDSNWSFVNSVDFNAGQLNEVVVQDWEWNSNTGKIDLLIKAFGGPASYSPGIASLDPTSLSMSSVHLFPNNHVHAIDLEIKDDERYVYCSNNDINKILSLSSLCNESELKLDIYDDNHSVMLLPAIIEYGVGNIDNTTDIIVSTLSGFIQTNCVNTSSTTHKSTGNIKSLEIIINETPIYLNHYLNCVENFDLISLEGKTLYSSNVSKFISMVNTGTYIIRLKCGEDYYTNKIFVK